MQLTAAIVGPAHGLKGEVYLDVRTDDPAGRLVADAVFTTDSRSLPGLTLVSVRRHKDRVLAAFREVTDRESAEALRGTRLLVEEDREDDAWYPHELEGLTAVDPDGRALGTVTGLRPGAAQDLLLVKVGERTVMVPFVEALVPTVDVAGGTVTIDAPAGLLDPSEGVDAR